MADRVQTSDDAFREIQLSGKQLVFLFIAATVVSIVIFLCGVLVGRGVRAERALLAQAGTPIEPVADLNVPGPAAVPAEADPTAAQPPVPVDDFSYVRQLESPGQVTGLLKPSSAASATAPAVTRRTPPDANVPPDAPPSVTTIAPDRPASTARASTVSASSVPAEPRASAPGYAVQVAALNVRSEADAIARRLSAKGYAAYVQVPAGSPSVYRVRVGTFKTRREADVVAARLQKEEQFKPWVTR